MVSLCRKDTLMTSPRPTLHASISIALFCSSFVYSNPFYDFRAQSVNLARDLSGWYPFMRQCQDEHLRGFIAATPTYTQTFRADRISTCLFGTSVDTDGCTQTIPIQGSLIQGRNPRAWLADYFGLPTDFDGSLSINPTIRTFLVDFAFYVDLSCVAHGLYITAHAPIVYTRWDLAVRECSTKGINDYPVGYFTSDGVNNSKLLGHALDFLSGSRVPDLGPDIRMHPLQCSTISSDCNTRTKVGVADIQTTLGWNFVCHSDYHMGISLHFWAPTGNKIGSRFVFSPIIGSGGHWKLGAGAHMHVALWRNSAKTAELGFYIDGYGQHLFAAHQERCFDLCGIENSRYMLAQRLGTTRIPPSLSEVSDAGVEFQNEYAPVANLTNSTIAVSVAVEGDFVASFVYTDEHFNVTAGYNYWGRTCDRIFARPRCCTTVLESQRWALKGDAQVIGFEETTNAPVRLAATESEATLQSGTNQFNINSPNRINTSIDNPKAATTSGGEVLDIPTLLPNHQTNSSNLPIIINQTDINFSGTKGSSNKVFVHLDYTWKPYDTITCHCGIGGEIEFTNRSQCADDCDSGCGASCYNSCTGPGGTCDFCALDQWGLWIKGGISFN